MVAMKQDLDTVKLEPAPSTVLSIISYAQAQAGKTTT